MSSGFCDVAKRCGRRDGETLLKSSLPMAPPYGDGTREDIPVLRRWSLYLRGNCNFDSSGAVLMKLVVATSLSVTTVIVRVCVCVWCVCVSVCKCPYALFFVYVSVYLFVSGPCVPTTANN